MFRRYAFREPSREREFRGLLQYGFGLVITKRQGPLWKPLSVSAALELVAQSRKLQLDDSVLEKQELAARRRMTRDPSEIAYLDDVLPELDPRIDTERRAVAEAAGWIQARSAPEQVAPACYIEDAPTPRERFRASPATGCVPLVRPNYEFFDRTLPRDVPQLVVVGPVEPCGPGADAIPGHCAANRALLDTVNVEALRALVR